MPAAKVKVCNNLDTMSREHHLVNTWMKGRDSLDNIIRQAIGRDPFLSFSRTGENPFQWIQGLNALDQQGKNEVSKDLKVENLDEGTNNSLASCNGAEPTTSDMDGVKSFHSLKDNEAFPRATKVIPDQTPKLSDAVVAFAQAAAKANGEPEKYLLGWPLLSPSKVKLQKCDKCSREFCSPINYRRHIRVHRKSLNANKDSSKNRTLLGAFWEKLSLDEAKEVVSLKDVTLGEITGPSILRVLASLIRNPGVSSLPHSYIRAGMALMDVIHARPSRFPLTSQELFVVLDDASEKTFMCAGTAVSLQKLLLDGEAGRDALEMNNLVACTSFMLEYKLVKAWLADKDLEALRCQKLLFEEEEAAQKRQAELLERKRMKKMRQREQRAKETGETCETNCEAPPSETVDTTFCIVEAPTPRDPMELDSTAPEALLLNRGSPAIGNSVYSYHDMETNSQHDVSLENTHHFMNHKRQLVPSRWQPISSGHHTSKLTKLNGFHSCPASAMKPAILGKHGSFREPKLSANNNKIWAPKYRPGNEADSSNNANHIEAGNRSQTAVSDNWEVLVGSISVPIKDDSIHAQDAVSPKDNILQEKPAWTDHGPNNASRSAGRQWRPVSRHGYGDSSAVHFDNGGTKMIVCPPASPSSFPPDEAPSDTLAGRTLVSVDTHDRIPFSAGETKMVVCPPAISSSFPPYEAPSDTLAGRTLVSGDTPDRIPFSADIAMAFLAQRWKEATAGIHAMVVSSPRLGTVDCLDGLETG